MATRRIVITICDICEQEKDTARVEVKIDTKVRRLDICGTCIKPLEKMFTKGQKPQTRKRRTKAAVETKPSRKVTDMEIIEQLKQEDTAKAS